ncbi:methyltransferase type 12 [Streptomyces eurocidicus]|uniref:Methyltransferase type 12 n=1 Tax=Streptomyces eurocidicus TaxID=66423 RepID=A0A2N8NUA9_STREU|nr:class I SAM-dependent methyltransferase [Streptomyces eurocidicus]MBB5120201.1 ubiquinone/menaquinone biosynthesis C-methylase UbiE [Streptomyces eurocidicus]MBF6056114.1 methyltransferase domain-containing protein [Streptomyces eurocidicus]PNE32357.1 methyltransferase type 12 [Streptomyces eurocidicus]
MLPSPPPPTPEQRASYRAALAQGVDRFLCAPRTTCPWCDAGRLRHRLHTTDLLQRKPGRFTLDQCLGCGHIFQNPRLNEDGLDFYYRDFYDGYWEERAGETWASLRRAYEERAAFAARHVRPKTWLDVGTGHGHFCAAAADRFPGTVFDGLDRGNGVELAARRGWIDRAHRGLFADLAPTLADAYDMVSMQHYLEHTIDPQRELRAAARVVRPGGHLFIEVPDPECRFGRALGRWWMPWFQPQHLHLMPLANLRRHLEGLGFTVVAQQRCNFNGPVNLLYSTYLRLHNAAPAPDAPWFPTAPSRLRRNARKAVFLGALPLLVAMKAADHLAGLLPSGARVTDAYRLLARRELAGPE